MKVQYPDWDVSLDAFHLSRTYGGVLEGHPTNHQIEVAACNTLARMWGENRPVRVIQAMSNPAPLVQCFAWVNGPPFDKNECGSHLFLIWWVAEADIAHPATMTAKALEGIHWAGNAEDYDV